MKSWHLTLILFLLIVFLAFWQLYSKQNVRQELISLCADDKLCIEQITEVQFDQLEMIKRESQRCNNNPQCSEIIALRKNQTIKPNLHIFIPRTHDSISKHDPK